MRSGKQDQALPHWDLSNIYPGLESPEFRAALQSLDQKLGELDAYMEQEGIRAGEAAALAAPDLAAKLHGFLERVNESLNLQATLDAYITGFVSTDSFNTLAKRLASELEMKSLRLERSMILLKGWMRAAAPDESWLEKAAETDEWVREHLFFLQETLRQSRYMMSEPEETLASELALSGGRAWGKLQRVVTSQVTVLFEVEGEVQELPMPALQNIERYHPDEGVRRAAFEAEIEAWEAVREPLAACMNGVKGHVITLDRRRGREDSLHASLDLARIDRATLEAMLGVMRESFPMWRRYFKAKAKRLGKERLSWWDRDVVPVPEERQRRFGFGEARQFLVSNFRQFDDKLADFTERAFEGAWIDAEPRRGKVGGAFCMRVPAVEESRILCNFDGSLDQVSTIAHELGHAFHNECLRGLTMLQRQTPMTLAETASIFNETIVVEAMLATAESREEEWAILETFLSGASQVIVDIYSRFLFEQEVFERREGSELSADDFCEIMLRAQKETYGEGLNPEHLHPYMWAWKPHYYSVNRSYYNYPYAFGLLFGLGLYAEYRERGQEFIQDYVALLRSTGMGMAADLAGRFGIDLRAKDFWRKSMDFIAGRVERYCEMAA